MIKNNLIKKQQEDLLNQLDNLEEEIKLINTLKERYDDVKSKLKTSMVEIGKKNKLEQLKWITPKGIQITCSIGKTAEYEEQEVEEFDIERLKQEYPHIYQDCCNRQKKKVLIKSGTSDMLRITMPKDN